SSMALANTGCPGLRILALAGFVLPVSGRASFAGCLLLVRWGSMGLLIRLLRLRLWLAVVSASVVLVLRRPVASSIRIACACRFVQTCLRLLSITAVGLMNTTKLPSLWAPTA